MSSFGKASDLLRLAEMAAARHLGIGLSEIEETHQPLAGTDQLGDCVANEMCG